MEPIARTIASCVTRRAPCPSPWCLGLDACRLNAMEAVSHGMSVVWRRPFPAVSRKRLEKRLERSGDFSPALVHVPCVAPCVHVPRLFFYCNKPCCLGKLLGFMFHVCWKEFCSWNNLEQLEAHDEAIRSMRGYRLTNFPVVYPLPSVTCVGLCCSCRTVAPHYQTNDVQFFRLVLGRHYPPRTAIVSEWNSLMSYTYIASH